MAKAKEAILPHSEDNQLADLAAQHEEWAVTLARAKENKKKALEDGAQGFTRRSAHETFHLLVRNMKEDATLIGKMFARVDTDGGGGIDARELHRVLEDVGMELNFVEVDRIFSLFDADGNGILDISEFKNALLAAADPTTADPGSAEVAEALGAAAARHVSASWQ
jgi:hypothetical protein